MEKVTLTRKELYDLVWSTPMTAIAKKYLISDVGLQKKKTLPDRFSKKRNFRGL